MEAKLTFEIDKQTVHVALAHPPVGSRSEAEIGMMGFIPAASSQFAGGWKV